MPSVGESWNQFELLEPLGTGGMGRVFLAEDRALERKVALKFLPDALEEDPAARERFLLEAKLAAALDHPYICKIYEIGEVDGKAYIAMEFVEGVTLQQKLTEGALPLGRVLDLGIELAEALQAAHKKGVVHRDVKTPNIIVTPEGHIKILDFGVARMVAMAALSDSQIDTYSGQLTSSRETSGTVLYMSPEQVRGEQVDGQTDIFSLGVVLYEMATGTIPFQGATSGIIYDAILNLGPRPPRATNPAVPEELERVILKALEKDKEHRYQSASELMVDLKRMRRDTDAGAGVVEGSSPEGKLRAGVGIAVAASALALVLAFAFLRPSSTSREGIDSLAVLPFENTRNDPEIDYLGDGIAETLINRLSPLAQLRVMARSTTFRFRGADIDPQSVGRALKVGAVLTGRVVRQGESLNVQAELVDVANGRQIWGEQYNESLTDIVEVQNVIAREISQALRLELTGEETRRLATSETSNSDAFRAYWNGRFHWNRRTNEDFKRAIELFEQAKRADPEFALAHVGIADSYLLLGAQFYGADEDYPPSVAMTKARTSARQALELNPNLAEAYVTLAYISSLYDWNWDAAEADFLKALELNPDYSVAHQWYSELLMVLGRQDEAVAEARRALELEPGSPIQTRELGFRLYQAGRYDEAINRFRETLEHDPSFSITRGMLIDALWHRGMRDEALAEAEEAGDGRLELLRWVREGEGGRDEARAWIDALPSGQASVSALAIYRALAGDEEKAIDQLEEAFRLRVPNLPLTLTRPDFAPFRSNPRLVELRQNMDLAL